MSDFDWERVFASSINLEKRNSLNLAWDEVSPAPLLLWQFDDLTSIPDAQYRQISFLLQQILRILKKERQLLSLLEGRMTYEEISDFIVSIEQENLSDSPEGLLLGSKGRWQGDKFVSNKSLINLLAVIERDYSHLPEVNQLIEGVKQLLMTEETLGVPATVSGLTVNDVRLPIRDDIQLIISNGSWQHVVRSYEDRGSSEIIFIPALNNNLKDIGTEIYTIALAMEFNRILRQKIHERFPNVAKYRDNLYDPDGLSEAEIRSTLFEYSEYMCYEVQAIFSFIAWANQQKDKDKLEVLRTALFRGISEKIQATILNFDASLSKLDASGSGRAIELYNFGLGLSGLDSRVELDFSGKRGAYQEWSDSPPKFLLYFSSSLRKQSKEYLRTEILQSEE